MNSIVSDSKLIIDKDKETKDSGDIWNEVENFLRTPPPNLAMYQRRFDVGNRAVNNLPLLTKRRSDACESISIDSALLQEAFDCADKLQTCDYSAHCEGERHKLSPIEPGQSRVTGKSFRNFQPSNLRNATARYRPPIVSKKSQLLASKATQRSGTMKRLASTRSIEVMADDLSRGLASEQLYKELRASQEKFAYSNAFLMQAKRSFFAQSKVVDLD
uniref:AlNc14C52G4063 protein n=1 Tax=Albugo laibachii Nc14 TaxID=890382 RepID=F0WBL8_9STRA|nr:AlNc14C52G4063 [Albugo laibachii Nc14]|eukprot:CCA18545.1 AlNc14C52G4063 [Albugo laibachii Nc14]